MYPHYYPKFIECLKFTHKESGFSWGTFVTFLAILVAFGGYFLADYLRRKPNKSNLVIEGAKVFPQNGQYIGRLIIKNSSEFKADSVEANVEQVFDNGDSRKDFLPVPLWWTHNQFKKNDISQRSIYGNQTVYLDIFSYIQGSEFRLQTPIKGVSTFDKIDRGETEIEIKLYQDSGQKPVIQKVKISWDGNNFPQINI